MYNNQYGGEIMIKTAFAGFEHPHMTGLYNDIAAADDFAVSGAYEPNEKARIRAEEKGVVFTSSDYDELLKSDASAVAVGSHFTARGQMIIDALKAGKHIIADKPLCTSLEELDEIQKLADEKNLAVCILLSLRENRNILGALKAVREGTVGKINNIIFEGEHPLNYGSRADWYFEKGKHGGVINDIAVHGIDLVRQFTGSEIDRVVGAREWNFYAKEVPHFLDSAQFILAMKDGTGVMADVSYSAPDRYGYSHPSYWHFRLFGEKGMLDFSEGSEKICFYPSQGEMTVIPAVETDKNLLTEFADIIRSKSSVKEYNDSMFEATRQTLIIQKAADNSSH